MAVGGPVFSWLQGPLMQDSPGLQYGLGSEERCLFIQQTHGLNVSMSLVLPVGKRRGRTLKAEDGKERPRGRCPPYLLGIRMLDGGSSRPETPVDLGTTLPSPGPVSSSEKCPD